MVELTRNHTASTQSASDPNLSSWVSANAGSGKTYVLVERILRLLLAGAAPQSILCLTYTRMAAAEMTNRLYTRLSHWLQSDDQTLGHELVQMGLIKTLQNTPEAIQLRRQARALFDQVLEIPGGMQIKTIHAFCESLLHRFPLEAGVMPNFSVIEQRDGQQWRDEVFESLLSDLESASSKNNQQDQLAWQSYLALVNIMNSDEIAAVILDFYHKRLALGPRYIEPAQAFKLKNKSDLTQELIEFRRAFYDKRPLNESLISPMATGGKKEKEAFEKIIKLISIKDFKEKSNHISNYLSVFLNQKGLVRKHLLNKATAQKYPQLLQALETEAQTLQTYRNHICQYQQSIIGKHLNNLADRLGELYQSRKDQAGVLDFDDLIARTVNLLGKDGGLSWVMFKLDQSIDHILVDESQDTSPEQWQIIERLADDFFTGQGPKNQPRSFFAVGDEKQSIYQFQGADPCYMAKVQAKIEDKVKAAKKRWQPINLARSYRSGQGLLNVVDAIVKSDPALHPLIGGKPALHQTQYPNMPKGSVILWNPIKYSPEQEHNPWCFPADYDDAPSGASVVTFGRIATTIRQWIDEPHMLEEFDHVSSQTRTRPISQSDILILVQRRKWYPDLIRQLKKQRLTVISDQDLDLNQSLVAMDMLSLAHFVLYPEDDFNLAATLKTPFIHLDDQHLQDLCIRRDSSLWQSLNNAGDRSSNSAIGNARHYLDRLRHENLSHPSAFFHHILFGSIANPWTGQTMTGYQGCIARLGPECVDTIQRFLDAVDQFENHNTPSIQGFCHWIIQRKTSSKREPEPARQGVRVMTVHGSKGLEAPIVILADSSQPSTSKNIIHDTKTKAILPWSPNAKSDERSHHHDTGNNHTKTTLLTPLRSDHVDTTYQRLENDLKKIEREENSRQLYVATTRACYRLYLASWHPGKNSSHSLGDQSWYDRIDSIDQATCPHIGHQELAQLQELKPAELIPSSPLPLSKKISSPLPPTTPPIMHPSRLDHDHTDLDDRPLAIRGLIIHDLLRHCLFKTRSKWSSTALSRCRQLIERAGIPFDDDHQLWCNEALAVLNMEQMQNFTPQNTMTEMPILGTWQGQRIDGRIDLCNFGSKSITLVDYKTSPTPPCIEKAFEYHGRQMAHYRHVMGQIYPDQPVQCALLWTSQPRMDILDQRLLSIR